MLILLQYEEYNYSYDDDDDNDNDNNNNNNTNSNDLVLWTLSHCVLESKEALSTAVEATRIRVPPSAILSDVSEDDAKILKAPKQSPTADIRNILNKRLLEKHKVSL